MVMKSGYYELIFPLSCGRLDLFKFEDFVVWCMSLPMLLCPRVVGLIVLFASLFWTLEEGQEVCL